MANAKILIRAPESPERRAAARMTGRYLMTVQSDAHDEISAQLNKAGMMAAKPLPRIAGAAKPFPDGTHLALKHIGVSLIDPTPQQEDMLQSMAARDSGVIALEPERMVRAVESMSDYVRGWRDAVAALTGKLIEEAPPPASLAQTAAAVAATWGLIATKVVDSPLSGNGISVAVLDTGFDLTHPDF